MRMYMQVPMEDRRCQNFGNGVIGNYELPDVGAGNRTPALCKSSKCS